MGSKKYRNRHVNKKLSAAIVDIAQPFLDNAETEEDMRGILNMAVSAWLVSVLPEDVSAYKVIEEKLDQEYGNEPELYEAMMGLFDFLLMRKQALYPNDMRVPMDYSIKEVDGALRLNVASTLPENQL